MPVVFWIHGGGYVADVPGTAGGDGGDFIREADGGVIAVVIQYRLGIFGFLAGSEIKAKGALNAGILDQRFALQWVQDHISFMSSTLLQQREYNDPLLEKLYAEVVDLANCTTSEDKFSCLTAVNSSALAVVNEQASLSAFSGTFDLIPVVDGDLIVERPTETLKKKQVNGDVLLVVTNAFDGHIIINESITSDLHAYLANVFPINPT